MNILVLTTDKGKKFNARKETAVGEEYYGIKVFRFYIVSQRRTKMISQRLIAEMHAL